MPVTVVEPPATPLTVLRTTLFPLLGPLGTAGLVLIFVIFMLIQREDLRDRLLRLIGQGRLNASTQALDEAAQRVSRYLLMQSLINGGTGLAVAIGLFFIGVPNAILWGLFAAVLRFIPYLGPWIAAMLPILISLAVFPGWEKPFLTLGLFLLIELVSNNVVEPLVYGSETGISTIGILVSAVFWTWLWGPVGLLMATPLTVCLVVMGRYVPQLQFLDVLLGDQPPLPIEAQVYHRLLAMDSTEVGTVLESCMKERTVAEFYDEVLIPALILAERDRHRGELSPEREEFIDTTMREWIEELAGRTVEDGSLGTETVDGKAAADRLVCVPAHDMADELAGTCSRNSPCAAGSRSVLEYDMPRSEALRQLAELGAEQVFISALAPFAYTQAREVCRDLRAHFPGLRIVVALWDLRAEAERYRKRLMAAGADEVVATLEEAVRAIRLAPAREADPAAVAGELAKAFREGDLQGAETLLAEAERKLPVESLAVEVLQPALEELRDDAAAGRIPAQQEKLCGDFLRERLFTLGDAAPQGQGYRALALSASEEEEEIGLLILSLLLRRAGWSVVNLGQRAPDEGFDDVIASVRPHAILMSAALRLSANRMLALAETLNREHPGSSSSSTARGSAPRPCRGWAGRRSASATTPGTRWLRSRGACPRCGCPRRPRRPPRGTRRRERRARRAACLRLQRMTPLALTVLAVALVSWLVWIQRRTGVFLEYLYFCRFPLSFGLLLAALPAIALWGAPSLLANLFRLTPGEILLISFFATLTAWMVLITLELIVAYAPSRFRVPRLTLPHWLVHYRIPLFTLLALPLIATAVVQSRSPLGRGLGMAAVGMVLAAAVLLLATYVYSRVGGTIPLVLEALPRVARGRGSGHGYIDPRRKLGRGHILAAAAFGVSVFLYGLGYFFLRPDRVLVPALAYMLLAHPGGMGAAGASFLLDRYRVPVVFRAPPSLLSQPDSTRTTTTGWRRGRRGGRRAAGRAFDASDLQELGQGDRPVVVVASGGGITARCGPPGAHRTAAGPGDRAHPVDPPRSARSPGGASAPCTSSTAIENGQPPAAEARPGS